MKKLFLVLMLLLPLALACHKSKPVEVEMQLPVPSATPTVIAVLSPTPLSVTPQPTPTETPALEYSIEDIKGTALIIPEDSTLPESVAEGEAVEAGDELLTKDDSEITLALNNDTMIHIAANSEVKIADLTPNTTNGFSSRIELLLGNILSEVEKLNESKSSFEIEAGGVVCAVRGTAFEVQKQGDNVSTSTFHGIVEMQKDGHLQNVNANEHSTFSLKRAGFLTQRRLSAAEKKHYQTWTKKKTMIQKRRADRLGEQSPSVKKDESVKRAKTGRKHQPMNHANAARAQQRAVKIRNLKKARLKNKRPNPKPATVRHQPKVQPRPNLKPQPRANASARRPQKKKRPVIKRKKNKPI